MSSLYSIGQMNELADALQKQGYSTDVVKKMCSGDLLTKALPVFAGLIEVKTVKHIIDCDVNPYAPNNWKVEEHKKGGRIEWNLEKVQLYLSPKQKDCPIEGYKLRKELSNKPVMNANVLDYLLKYPQIIPEERKYKRIFFFGTVYRSSGGRILVRCLVWEGGWWDWDYGWLGDSWIDFDPSVLFVS